MHHFYLFIHILIYFDGVAISKASRGRKSGTAEGQGGGGGGGGRQHNPIKKTKRNVYANYTSMFMRVLSMTSSRRWTGQDYQEKYKTYGVGMVERLISSF